MQFSSSVLSIRWIILMIFLISNHLVFPVWTYLVNKFFYVLLAGFYLLIFSLQFLLLCSSMKLVCRVLVLYLTIWVFIYNVHKRNLEQLVGLAWWLRGWILELNSLGSNLDPPLTSCIPLDWLFNCFGLSFLISKMGTQIYLLYRITVTIKWMLHLQPHLPRRDSVTVGHCYHYFQDLDPFELHCYSSLLKISVEFTWWPFGTWQFLKFFLCGWENSFLISFSFSDVIFGLVQIELSPRIYFGNLWFPRKPSS